MFKETQSHLFYITLKKQEQKQKQQQLSGKKGQSLSPCDAKRVTDFRNF